MQLPLQVTFRNMDRSDAVEAAVRERAEKLDEFFGRIMACRVTVEAPHRQHRKGKIFHVRVDLTVPGEEIVVRRDPAEHGAHEDIYVTVRDAFDAAQRRLQDYVRRHSPTPPERHGPPHAKIRRLLADRDCGFLETADGREIYFHRNAVVGNGYEQLEPGMEVRFVETLGDEGPQASTVEVLGRNAKHQL